MPWDSKDARRFTHDPSVDPKKWAAIADAIRRRTSNEGLAIRIANSKAKGSKS